MLLRHHITLRNYRITRMTAIALTGASIDYISDGTALTKIRNFVALDSTLEARRNVCIALQYDIFKERVKCNVAANQSTLALSESIFVPNNF